MTGAPSPPAGLPLAASLREAPRIARPDVAEDRLADLKAAYPGLAQRMAANDLLRGLLAAVADHSPFLWQLVASDPARLCALLDAPPAATIRRIVDGLAADLGGIAVPEEAKLPLRRARAELALLVALCDLGGVWEFGEVVAALTRFADAAVSAALDVLLREAVKAGRLKDLGRGPHDGCGLVVLALGKGGGGELNYSSDIDLVVLFDGRAPALPEGAAPAPFYVKLTQGLVRLLGERTGDGYVFRVDLRLRPDPGSTAVAVSVPAALAYYESLGQNWERAAYIKARPIAGDRALGRAVLKELEPFIWRKYFDYAAIADVHAMKRQIHAVRGHAAVAVPGHDVKLGRGGIREVEFFVQTQQLIFGGRRPRLRGTRTLDMLSELRRDGWVSADAEADLSAAYLFLRRIEHRLQMIADEQTQRLPADPDALARFAAWAGYDDLDAFEAHATRIMRSVEAHYARLFEHAPALAVGAGSLMFAGPTVDAETVATLRDLGFKEAEKAVETVRGWHFGRRPAIRTPRAREVLTELVPALLTAFSGSGDPDGALAAFDDALGRLPAVVELLTILKRNDALRRLFADILGVAPRLARAVVRRPHLLDAAIDPANLGSGATASMFDRVDGLDPAMPAEDFLDRIRDLAQEDMFLTGVRLLAGTQGPAEAGRAYSALADAVLRATLAHCRHALAAEHGVVPHATCALLALGRLGSREMTASSDLDLILVYDVDPAHDRSDGPRPLDAARYFTRLTQRLIAALTVMTRRGTLYEVDMRLRPSGRQGPLAARFPAFVDYQMHHADTWEHMALTRARVVAGDRALGSRVEDVLRQILSRPRHDAIGPEIAALRALVAREKGDKDHWNLKLAKGGMLDVDFVAQFLALRHAATHPEILAGGTGGTLREARRLALLPEDAAGELERASALYGDLIQAVRLATLDGFDPSAASEGVRRLLVTTAGAPDFAALDDELRDCQHAVRAIFEDVLGVAGGLRG